MTWACSLQVFFSFFTSIANIWNCHYSTLCCFILSKVSDQGWRALMKANNCNNTLWVVRDISSSISYYCSVHSLVSFYFKWKWHDIRPSTRNSCSAFNHSSAHTQREHTHTPWTHTVVGSHSCCSAREQLGVRCLAQGHLSRGIEGGERALVIHSPHLLFLLARDSNSQPLVYESDSLTIRPRLPRSNFNKIL